MGSNSGHGMGWYKGLVDDLRIYSRELSAAQINDLANGLDVAFVKAENPTPVDGAEGISSPLLTWTKGETALWHRVYLRRDAGPGTGGLQDPLAAGCGHVLVSAGPGGGQNLLLASR